MKQTYFSLIALFILFNPSCSELEKTQKGNTMEEINVGIILDMGSWTGKIGHSIISMAISDFYALNSHYKTRLVLHTKDSKGDPLGALSAGSLTNQIGMIFWYSFSTLVFAHREKLISNLSKFVVIVWVFVVLILSSSYTATLSSMLTVQQIQLASNDYIGFQSGFLTLGAISNLNFEDSRLKQYKSPEEYADALARGSKNGGVSAIIDEIPYIKIFLAQYSDHYTMINPKSITSGFGFVFPKGSPLVPEISRAIAGLRQRGKLMEMEDKWLKSQSTFTSQDLTSSPNSALNLHEFGGLFLISAMCLTLALVIYLSLSLYEKWHIVRDCNFPRVIRGHLELVNRYFI